MKIMTLNFGRHSQRTSKMQIIASNSYIRKKRQSLFLDITTKAQDSKAKINWDYIKPKSSAQQDKQSAK